jgi:conjugal transfer mating pair stabilization protein TraN
MIRPFRSAMALTLSIGLLSLAAPARAQSTELDAAKAEGKAFGTSLGNTAQQAASTAPDADRIPGFNSSADQSRLFDDPDRMARDAASQADANPGYAAMRSSIDRRARFAPIDLDATIARSKAISSDPLSYTAGMQAGGSEGRCVPLPQSNTSPGSYQASCNVGYKLEEYAASCVISLTAVLTTVVDYHYMCTPGGVEGQPNCTALPATTCRQTGSHAGPCKTMGRDAGGNSICITPGTPVADYICSAVISGLPPVQISTRQVAETSRDESQCQPYAGNDLCFAQGDQCTDSSPVTRRIGGVDVTAPCWAWSRSYQCYRYVPMQDCDELAATPGCSVTSETCITGEAPCRTLERLYTCPLPPQPSGQQQFICDGDVYCLDGSCETITREANDEFKDAVTALNAMAQANREWDPSSLRLFKGTRETCSSKVFGILNCCKGKGFPLIPGIQLLVALACNREEMLLHEKDNRGLCAYVGTYCSSRFLGVCLTKRKAYCCFESKLSRILQEQGRRQLGRGWGDPRTETCAGFTAGEFALLDLSQMDFSEVYAEFTDAARLPDELQTASQMQQKIEDFYANARP